MAFEMTLDELYKDGETDMFAISLYLSLKYGDNIMVTWDVQEWGKLKSMFCKKKTGYELQHIGALNKINVCFYDKRRETVERLEEELDKDKVFRVYSLINRLSNDDMLEGVIDTKIEDGKVVITVFGDENLRGDKDGFINKLVHFLGNHSTKWENKNGIELMNLYCDVDKFLLIISMMNRG